MAKINDPPKAPLWPWGGPRSVRERLVDPLQFDRKKKVAKKGDPKNPALPSSALLDSIGPAHTADELRLPMPPHPQGHDADLEHFLDAPFLDALSQRAAGDEWMMLERGLSNVQASHERVERLKALLYREGKMLAKVRAMRDEMIEIRRKMREEQRDEGY